MTMAKVKKLRVRGHHVVLNRSKAGDTGIIVMLLILGAFMFVPMVYSVFNAFKPLEEFFYFPPILFRPNLLRKTLVICFS